MRRELSAVANVLASMAAIATAVWWAAGNMPVAEVSTSCTLFFLHLSHRFRFEHMADISDVPLINIVENAIVIVRSYGYCCY